MQRMGLGCFSFFADLSTDFAIGILRRRAKYGHHLPTVG
jgi:hypothetical protein